MELAKQNEGHEGHEQKSTDFVEFPELRDGRLLMLCLADIFLRYKYI